MGGAVGGTGLMDGWVYWLVSGLVGVGRVF